MHSAELKGALCSAGFRGALCSVCNPSPPHHPQLVGLVENWASAERSVPTAMSLTENSEGHNEEERGES